MHKAEPAIYCRLSQPELRQRKADIRKCLSAHVVASSYEQGMSELDFAKPAFSRMQLERLIELEQACCPFFTFEVREFRNEFTLIISGPEGSDDFVRDLFSSEKSAFCACSG